MSRYSASVRWRRHKDEDFTAGKYSRGHEWLFDGGLTVPASASPQVVPLPWSVETGVDPEEAFVASLSSCHMLFFLSFASKKGFIVSAYTDEAVGIMAKNNNGKMGMTKVTLRPRIEFDGEQRPNFDQLKKIHQQAHEACFIANSVTTEVVTEIIDCPG